MIPIRDTVQSRYYPVVNSAIIATNFLVYLIQMAQGNGLRQFVLTYALIPARYSVPEIASQFTLGQQTFSFLSFMFLHGGFWHLLGNMWSLYIFGDNVEDRLGPVKYLFFYLLCGLASGLTHLFVNWHSELPTIGASGAIAGVMGAYFLLYPGSRILTLIPIFFLPYFIEIPAYFFLGIWFLLQFISAAAGPVQGGAGIAWWAHIGGFVFGMLFLELFLRIPEPGINQRIRQKTSKRKSHRLQVIKPAALSKLYSEADDPHLYGTVVITPREAELGTRKLVNITTGSRKRFFRVNIPPGSREGTLLRLAGVGQQLGDGTRGNVYLRILIG